ncbi:DUF6572 domain-containing protein [Shewanella mangrovisoli]|uniref:DUF6572 domain-containing protein n=1 Tax=Shewanella mangrovisoli TaxID=2864211 RepID=UPI001C6609BC|nr:DUF6572 domain-containing protein [Shewanella mangrovisoli]QYK07984.1 hypothetical protein K0H60_14320 [Shewanella mangrovisoli]
MSIEDQDSIDAIGIDNEGVVVLTISDHLEWDDKHLLLLQEKINIYLAFLESGEVFESYPDSRGREFKINIMCKYEPTALATQFLSQCTDIINQVGIQFGYKVFT